MSRGLRDIAEARRGGECLAEVFGRARNGAQTRSRLGAG
jgi:hypothetical protein